MVKLFSKYYEKKLKEMLEEFNNSRRPYIYFILLPIIDLLNKNTELICFITDDFYYRIAHANDNPRVIENLTNYDYGYFGIIILKKYFNITRSFRSNNCLGDDYLIDTLRSGKKSVVVYLLDKIEFVENRAQYENCYIIQKFEIKYLEFKRNNTIYETIMDNIDDIVDIAGYNAIIALTRDIMVKIFIIFSCIELFDLIKYKNFIDIYYESISSKYPLDFNTMFTIEYKNQLNKINKIYGKLLKQIRNDILFKEKFKSLFSNLELVADRDNIIDSNIKKAIFNRI